MEEKSEENFKAIIYHSEQDETFIIILEFQEWRS